MKKIILTFGFILSTVIASNAQTTSVAPDTVKTETPQVEFYSSEEEFLKQNPSFPEQVRVIAINKEAYIHYIILNKVLRRRLIA